MIVRCLSKLAQEKISKTRHRDLGSGNSGIGLLNVSLLLA